MDEWSWRILPLFVDATNSTERSPMNRSFDIFCKSCVNDYDPIACARSTTIGVLSILTSVCCAARIFSLHRPVRTDYHKLILFYVLFLQTVTGSSEWLFGWKTQAALFNLYARALELLIICHLYLMLMCRVMHWTRHVATRLPVFGLTLMFVYFTILLTIGLVFAMEPWKDCHAPYWIWLSAGNVITVQMIVISFILIIRRLNDILTEQSLRPSHKQQLCSLLWAFETSSIVDLSYHITLYLLADEEGCGSIFKHDQWRYTAVKVPYELISFLLPIWVILIVFRAPAKSRDSYVDGSPDSSFLEGSRPRSLSNVIVVRNWRRRYRPLGSSQWAFVNPLAQIAAQRPRRTSRNGNGPSGRRTSDSSRASSFRRTQSVPTLVVPRIRRNSLSFSVISSPLDPIPEEVHPAQSHSSSSISSDHTSLQPVVDSN